MAKVVASIGLCVIFTLYLAPTKYFMADLLAVLLLIMVIGVFGLHRSGIITAIKPLAPLLAISLYVVVFDLSRRELGAVPYVMELLTGFVPFLLLYVMFRNQERSDISVLAVGVFFVPGLWNTSYSSGRRTG